MAPLALVVASVASSSAAAAASAAPPPPEINGKVYHHLVHQFTEGHAMFQHFGVSTFGGKNTLGIGGANDCWHGSTV